MGQGGAPDAILSGHRPLADKLLTIITFWRSVSIQTTAAFLASTGLAVQETNRPITSAANNTWLHSANQNCVLCWALCIRQIHAQMRDGKMFNTLRDTPSYKGTQLHGLHSVFHLLHTTPHVCRKSTGQSLECYCEWQLHFASPLHLAEYLLRECCDKDDHAVHQRKFKGTLCRNCHFVRFCAFVQMLHHRHK